jgi:hypothetical protein
MRHYIDLSDLLGLRMECKECHASLELPMARNGSRVPLACPNCKAEWFDQYAQPNIGGLIAGFVEQFKYLKNAFDQSPTAHFTMTLEISGPTPAKGSQA